jgi:hypothetical protein
VAQATGTIKFVNPKTRRFSLQPDEGERMVFKFNPRTEVTLDGEEAKPEDIEVGRRGKINYFVRDDLNRVRSIELEGGATT